MLDWVFLTPLRRYSDYGLCALRLVTGIFLVLSVWSIASTDEGMIHFTEFLDHKHFPAPEIMAPLSIWVQFSVGLAFIMGLFTRWAGILCAINFLVAVVMVDRGGGVRGALPSAMLAATGVYLALRGAGRFGLDRLFEHDGAVDALVLSEVVEDSGIPRQGAGRTVQL